MIEFSLLSLRNFLSYGNNTTIFDLRRPGTTLIVGENLDQTSDGAGANGVGKSTIVNAIAYALYDKPVSDISKDNLVNNINNKNMEVTLEYVGDDGAQYKIHRFRKMKAGAEGNGVHFYMNGKDVTPDSVAATNEAIERTIGIPYELFVRIIVFSASHNPFLSLKTDEQKGIIEELFGLTAISQKADLLKKQIKDTEGRISIQQVKIDAASEAKERHLVQIENAKRRVNLWSDQNTNAINALKDKLTKIEGVDFDVQQDLHNTLASSQKRLNEALDMQRMSDRAIRELAKRKAKLEADLTHLADAQCPYCLQHYADAEAKVIETKTQIADIDTELDTLDAELEVIEREVATVSVAIKDIKSQIVVDDIEELLNVKNESDNIHRKIKELETAVNPHLEQLQDFLDEKLDTVDFTSINELTREKEHQQFLLKLLTKKDSFIRKALLNKNLPLLNTKLQHYITMLGLPHRVEFTKEMSATISQFGRKLDFGNLSQGQRARVNFALSMAFRDVLQNLHPKINICMLDEVLDFGLDSVGVIAAAKLVKQKARDENVCMFVISHRDEVSTIFDKRMVIQMSKQFSYVVDEMVR